MYDKLDDSLPDNATLKELLEDVLDEAINVEYHLVKQAVAPLSDVNALKVKKFNVNIN